MITRPGTRGLLMCINTTEQSSVYFASYNITPHIDHVCIPLDNVPLLIPHSFLMLHSQCLFVAAARAPGRHLCCKAFVRWKQPPVAEWSSSDVHAFYAAGKAAAGTGATTVFLLAQYSVMVLIVGCASSCATMLSIRPSPFKAERSASVTRKMAATATTSALDLSLPPISNK